jgi:hypothetical protein
MWTQDPWDRGALDIVQGRPQDRAPSFARANLGFVTEGRSVNRGDPLVRIPRTARWGRLGAPAGGVGASSIGACGRGPTCLRSGAGSVSALARWPDGTEATYP